MTTPIRVDREEELINKEMRVYNSDCSSSGQVRRRKAGEFYLLEIPPCQRHFHSELRPTRFFHMFRYFKNRKYLAAWAGVLFSLFMLTSKRYSVSFDGVVNGVQPVVVWEYVMDFNNMKGLNPTIKDFSILSDTNVGNPFDWQYQVKYTEVLHQIPFIWNEAIATYDFKTISEKEFEIISKHITCFFMGSYCVKTFSKFIFQHTKGSLSDTYCLEEVNYECPRILSHFCYNEVIYQRKSIFQNLQKKLSLQ